MSAESSVGAILDDVAADLDGIEPSGGPGSRRWSAGGRLVAREIDGGVELALDPAVAAAAVRTPDTHPSSGGHGWIAFTPPVVDGHAEDRLRAWFALAVRLGSAGSGRGSRGAGGDARD